MGMIMQDKSKRFVNKIEGKRAKTVLKMASEASSLPSVAEIHILETGCFLLFLGRKFQKYGLL